MVIIYIQGSIVIYVYIFCGILGSLGSKTKAPNCFDGTQLATKIVNFDGLLHSTFGLILIKIIILVHVLNSDCIFYSAVKDIAQCAKQLLKTVVFLFVWLAFAFYDVCNS